MESKFSLAIDITPAQIIEAIMRMKKNERNSLVEDILATASPEYLKSIEEARTDYKKGRVYTHDEVFDSK